MTTLNIRIRALEHNIEIIKSLAADAQIIAVLKGNAYGLGGHFSGQKQRPQDRCRDVPVFS